MASLNKVMLIGNLTREPELRYTPGGAAVCEFGLAINRRYVSNNQERDETCFVDIVVWGKQAESTSRFLQKGSPAFIEGRLQFDQWEDRETGKKRSRIRVVAERVQFLSKGNGGSSAGSEPVGDYPQAYKPAQSTPQQQSAAPATALQTRPAAPAQQLVQQYSAPQQPVQQQPAQQGFTPQHQASQQAAPQGFQGQPQPAQPTMPQAPFSVDDVEDDIPF